MNKICVDITNLHALIFERRQIIALLEDTDLWCRIPLPQRFDIVNSHEFITLMGESFTEQIRLMLEDEIEALTSTIH